MRKIPDWVAPFIVEKYQEIEGKTGIAPTATEIHDELMKRMERRRDKVPVSLRKVQLVLTQARPRLDELSDLERPWTLVDSSKYGIPLEAARDLLVIWRECLINERVFTVRQARWVAQLRHVLPREEPPDLYNRAVRYAQRERAAEALNKRADTSDLDAYLAFREPWKGRDSKEFIASLVRETLLEKGEAALEKARKEELKEELQEWSRLQWEYMTAKEVGLISGTLEKKPEEMERKERTVVDLTDAEFGAMPPWIRRLLSVDLTDAEFRAIVKEMPLRDSTAELFEAVAVGLDLENCPEPSPQQRKVYFMWLRKIARSPRWAKMSVQERLQMAQRLHDWVAAQWEALQVRQEAHSLVPREILKEVGIED